MISNGDHHVEKVGLPFLHHSSLRLDSCIGMYFYFLTQIKPILLIFCCSSPLSFYNSHLNFTSAQWIHEFQAWLWKLLRTQSSPDDFYSLETRERGKIMGDCNIECDATLTRPRLGWWRGPGLVPSLISPPIKSCRNIFNWSILKERKGKRLSWHGQLWHSWDQIYFLIEVDNQ